MVSKAGAALRGATTLIRALQFLIAALVLGIFSYFLASESFEACPAVKHFNDLPTDLSRHHTHIPTWMKAVEGMAGAAVIYTAFAVILTCFLGGITFFAFLALLFDFAFVGAFVAIAVLTRGGARSCRGKNVPSPLGTGKTTACKLETTVFAVAIIAA